MERYTILWIGKLKVVKMSILSHIDPLHNPNQAFSVKTGKLILKFLWKHNQFEKGEQILRTNIDFETYTQIGQCHRVWSPETGPRAYGHLLFNGSTKAFPWRMERQSHSTGRKSLQDTFLIKTWMRNNFSYFILFLNSQKLIRWRYTDWKQAYKEVYRLKTSIWKDVLTLCITEEMQFKY